MWDILDIAQRQQSLRESGSLVLQCLGCRSPAGASGQKRMQHNFFPQPREAAPAAARACSAIVHVSRQAPDSSCKRASEGQCEPARDLPSAAHAALGSQRFVSGAQARALRAPHLCACARMPGGARAQALRKGSFCGAASGVRIMLPAAAPRVCSCLARNRFAALQATTPDTSRVYLWQLTTSCNGRGGVARKICPLACGAVWCTSHQSKLNCQLDISGSLNPLKPQSRHAAGQSPVALLSNFLRHIVIGEPTAGQCVGPIWTIGLLTHISWPLAPAVRLTLRMPFKFGPDFRSGRLAACLPAAKLRDMKHPLHFVRLTVSDNLCAILGLACGQCNTRADHDVARAQHSC